MATEARRAILRAALERKGLTLKEACAQAGLSHFTVFKWISGQKKAQRETLTRLVEFLEAPELLEAIPWHWRSYTIICPECSRIREYQPGQFRFLQAKGEFRGLAIDPETGRAEHPCNSCRASVAAYRLGISQRAKLVKRGGLLLVANKARAGLTHRWASRPAPSYSPEHRWAISVGQVRPRPKGLFDLCRDCGYLAHLYESERRPRPPRPAPSQRRHLACPRGKAQLTHRERYPSSEELAASFMMAVAHLIHDVDIGSSRHQGGTGLAAYFDLERRTVQYRINILLAMLPPDDRGGKRVTRWTKALRWAKAKRDLRDWAKQEGWPWQKILRRLSQLHRGAAA